MMEVFFLRVITFKFLIFHINYCRQLILFFELFSDKNSFHLCFRYHFQNYITAIKFPICRKWFGQIRMTLNIVNFRCTSCRIDIYFLNKILWKLFFFVRKLLIKKLPKIYLFLFLLIYPSQVLKYLYKMGLQTVK